tara:strand:+ start:503 stop:646 length:144 start_codon:yes stop_codon:yes gene_type:complete
VVLEMEILLVLLTVLLVVELEVLDHHGIVKLLVGVLVLKVMLYLQEE